jgi:hypothetical protein
LALRLDRVPEVNRAYEFILRISIDELRMIAQGDRQTFKAIERMAYGRMCKHEAEPYSIVA